MSDSVDRKNVVRAHITQDDFGYWMMSLECGDGTMVLASYAAERPEHEIFQAYHPQDIGLPVATEFLISQPAMPLQACESGWTKPEPRRAREPYYIVKNGLRVY